MYIELETLFSFRQYVDLPIEYYFDIKTYTIIDASSKSSIPLDKYDQCIPLFQINQEKIQYDYICLLNNRNILYEYNHKNVCFEEFIQRHLLWQDWWRFYKDNVLQLAIEWCKKNNINYARW